MRRQILIGGRHDVLASRVTVLALVLAVAGCRQRDLNFAGQLGNGSDTGPESCGEFNPCSGRPVAVVPPGS